MILFFPNVLKVFYADGSSVISLMGNTVFFSDRTEKIEIYFIFRAFLKTSFRY